MNRHSLTLLAVTTLIIATQSAFAQWPAGTPREDTGARPSQMGTPAPQEKLETHRNEQGQIVTEDGQRVKAYRKTIRFQTETCTVPSRKL